MVSVSQNKTEIILAGEATVHTADALHEALAEALAPPEQTGASPPMRVDLSGLTEIDLAGAQLLIAFRRTLGMTRACYHGCPEALRAKLGRVGLDTYLFEERPRP